MRETATKKKWYFLGVFQLISSRLKNVRKNYGKFVYFVN